MPSNLSVTIITASYNAHAYIMQSMNSVFDQTYPNIEHIVVDGGSTDDTIQILKEFELKVKSSTFAKASADKQKLKFYWKSEKDRGIADAFNKGIRMSQGNYIYFLGANDVLKDRLVIEKMMHGVDSKKDIIICGKIDRIKKSNTYSALYTSSIRFSPWQLLYKMALPHQGMFIHRNFFRKYGYFDTNFRYAMDYDLLLRAYHEFPNVILKDIVVAGWREGGVGKNKLYEILDEYHHVRMKNHIAPAWILRIIHEAVKVRYKLVKFSE